MQEPSRRSPIAMLPVTDERALSHRPPGGFITRVELRRAKLFCVACERTHAHLFESRGLTLEVVKEVGQHLSIPFPTHGVGALEDPPST